MKDVQKEGSLAFTNVWGDDFESRAEAAERQRVALENRLALLLSHRPVIERAAKVAVEGSGLTQGSTGRNAISVDSGLLGRLWKNEPRPVLARLLSSRSDYVLQVMLLALLHDLEPWEPSAKRLRWDALLLPTRSISNSHELDSRHDRGSFGTEAKLALNARIRRSARRALTIITDEWRLHDSEMREWKRMANEPRVRAWTTPQRPLTVQIPGSFFANGWHLTLTKSELAWWLAGRLVHPRLPTERLRTRYVGFSKHTTGTNWLPMPATLEAVDPDASAPGKMSARLLRSLGLNDEMKWPNVSFAEGEFPELVVQGRTDKSERAVLIATNHQWHPFEAQRQENRPPILTRVASLIPSGERSGGVQYAAFYDPILKTFRVTRPHQISGDRLFFIPQVEGIWGDSSLYALWPPTS